jgi:hypothetical protein
MFRSPENAARPGTGRIRRLEAWGETGHPNILFERVFRTLPPGREIPPALTWAAWRPASLQCYGSSGCPGLNIRRKSTSLSGREIEFAQRIADRATGERSARWVGWAVRPEASVGLAARSGVSGPQSAIRERHPISALRLPPTNSLTLTRPASRRSIPPGIPR